MKKVTVMERKQVIVGERNMRGQRESENAFVCVCLCRMFRGMNDH